jgi:hypothetical protein
MSLIACVASGGCMQDWDALFAAAPAPGDAQDGATLDGGGGGGGAEAADAGPSVSTTGCANVTALFCADFDLGPLERGWTALDAVEGDAQLDGRASSPPFAFRSSTRSGRAKSTARLDRGLSAGATKASVALRLRVLEGGNVDKVQLVQMSFGSYGLYLRLREGGAALEEYDDAVHQVHRLPQDLGRTAWASVELEASLALRKATVRVDGEPALDVPLTPTVTSASLGIEVGVTADDTTEVTTILFDDVVVRD